MGGFFKSPKPERVTQPATTAAASAAAVEPAASAESDADVAARRERVQALVQQRRGRASTIATSSRGLLVPAGDGPARKSLLGE